MVKSYKVRSQKKSHKKVHSKNKSQKRHSQKKISNKKRHQRGGADPEKAEKDYESVGQEFKALTDAKSKYETTFNNKSNVQKLFERYKQLLEDTDAIASKFKDDVSDNYKIPEVDITSLKEHTKYDDFKKAVEPLINDYIEAERKLLLKKVSVDYLKEFFGYKPKKKTFSESVALKIAPSLKK